MDKKSGVFFNRFSTSIDKRITFVLSSKTEAGSAGEQPAKDSLMADEKVKRKES